MKTLFSIAFSLLTFINVSYCQIIDNVEWAPQGATWMYDLISMGSVKHLIVSYERDTTISGKNCKVFSTKVKTYYADQNQNNYLFSEVFGENYFFYKSQDTIFWYNPTTTLFEMMYDFNLVPGENYEVFPNGNSFNCNSNLISNYIVVSDTGTNTYSGRIFNYQDFLEAPYWTIGSRVVKNIGSLFNFLPEPSVNNCAVIDGMNGAVGSLNCYYDNTRGTVAFNQSSEDMCNTFMFSTFSQTEHKSILPVTIFPNPTSETLQIKVSDGTYFSQINIYDSFGRKALYISGVDPVINVGSLASGIYFIEIIVENHQAQILKFIKK